MFLIGWMIAVIDALPRNRAYVLSGCAVLIPLLTNVRNSFIDVPFHVMLGLLIVYGLMTVARFNVRAKRRTHVYAANAF
jgi:hypothetical protein